MRLKPFPGPGIAIRILGDITPERVEIARKADYVRQPLYKNFYTESLLLTNESRSSSK